MSFHASGVQTDPGPAASCGRSRIHLPVFIRVPKKYVTVSMKQLT
jgi:hypothetical protein